MKIQTFVPAFLLASTLCSSAGTSASVPPITNAAPTEERDDWSFEIAPYVWIASLEADSSLPWDGPGTDPSVQRFDTKITGAFMIEALARYRAVGILVDFNWLQLDTETLRQGVLYSGADLQTDYLYTTAALTYLIPLEGDFHAELMAGARLWSISADFELNPGLLAGRGYSSSETWVSPLAGAKLSYDLNQDWQLFFQGTAGGFSGSSAQWDLCGGVNYQFNDWCVATVGYRYLSEEYENDDFSFDATVQGAQVGLRFRF